MGYIIKSKSPGSLFEVFDVLWWDGLPRSVLDTCLRMLSLVSKQLWNFMNRIIEIEIVSLIFDFNRLMPKTRPPPTRCFRRFTCPRIPWTEVPKSLLGACAHRDWPIEQRMLALMNRTTRATWHHWRRKMTRVLCCGLRRQFTSFTGMPNLAIKFCQATY